METLLVILHVFILLLLIIGLFAMQKKHVSFSKRVFTALGLGIVFGFALQLIYGPTSNIVVQTADWFNIVGGGYVKLLQMIVMPLVFISILGAFTKMKLTKNLGKISGLIIGILVATTAVAAAVGIASALSFDLHAIQVDQGNTELSRGQELEQKSEEMTAKTLPQQMIELLPGNPFLDFTGARPTSTIGVVIFAAFLGIAFLGVRRKQPEQAETFKKLIDAVYAIVMRVVTLILRLTPYGVLAIMTKTIATSDIDSILKLGMFVIASYAALIVMFIIHLLLLTISGLNPVVYLKKALPVLVFAFTSRSSAGALPLNIKTQRSLGVPEGIANFAGSFGLSIGQNGCAGIYPAMLAMMIAPTIGQNPFDPAFIISVIAVVAISSFGVAGVGGGATFAALLVLSALNMPVALAGLLISIEPLIDMGRTALNVSGSMTSGLITSKVTKEIDSGVFQDRSNVIEAEEA
ncbi:MULTISPECIES: L-cystine transporter [Bacillus]|uniref:L-cystine transporter n=1 Tax=Bacillus TaxID=1386 RepID=UPI0003A91245|nr:MULTISPECIES: L-cystine transporter [Bacillus]QQF62760.1 L-cystine transporter [Bacillus mojavensis]BDG79207.1 L-cystine uptake protein TcyP [Bacillus subtilis]KUP31394.1 sodium:dicarboxylate symporter [Bacillus halotolerans]KUP34127.1 sodium:dicarboxylate symporter [Bacillus halotolerans]KUP39374.1 sodium:dicarboxylate symporter [Bacillus halotolerans]